MAQANHKNVWVALAAAQIKFEAIEKQVLGHFGKYAPLESILEVIRPALNAEGIAISTTTDWTPATRVIDGGTGVVTETDGYAEIVTRLWHGASETHIASVLPLPIVENQQQVGKTITYFRRYLTCAVSGCQPRGEDTETAEGKGSTRDRTDITASASAVPGGANRRTSDQDASVDKREHPASSDSSVLMFPDGSLAPDRPSWREWREDPVSKQGKWASITWGEMCGQSLGSDGYGFCRYMLTKGDLNPGYAAKLRYAVFEIESKTWESPPTPPVAEVPVLKTPEEIPF